MTFIKGGRYFFPIVLYSYSNHLTMFLKGGAFFLLAFLMSFGVSAQRLITGKVLDLNTKEPVDKLVVTIYKGTSFAITNHSGFFQLNINEGDSLLISHQNYELGLIAMPATDVFSLFVKRNEYYPAYLDGEWKLFTFLERNIKYPRAARAKKIEGILYMELGIDSTGNIDFCKALNNIGSNFEKEVIPVFLNIPGEWSQSHCPTSFIFPIIFRIGYGKTTLEVQELDFPVGKMMRQITVVAEY